MLLAGDTVVSNVSGLRGTVIAPPLAMGMVRVRFDEMRGAVEVHESRVRKIEVKPLEEYTEDPQYFKKGDYVQIVDGNGTTYKGTALADYSRHTLALFDFLTDEGKYMDVNANYYNITVLFRADVARGEDPKY